MANKTASKPISPFTQGATATPQTGLLTDEVKMGKPSGGAGLLDVGIASIMPDLESKISYYSQELGVPRESFGVRQGEIVYTRPDGVIQPVEAGFSRQALSGVGETIPAITGIGGAVVGAPLGVAGMLAGGATGAAGGQALREGIAGMVVKKPLDLQAGKRIALAGAIDLGAGMAGALIGKGVSRALATEAANTLRREVGRVGMDTATALKNTLNEINTKYGTSITLTPAEITGAAGLRAQQMALGAEPRTAEKMSGFYAGRGEELGKAAKGFMEEISPVADKDVAGEQLVKVAGEAMALTRAERTAAGKPAYDLAFQRPVLDEAGEIVGYEPRLVNLSVFDSQLNQLVADYAPLKRQLTKIKDIYKNKTNQPLEFVQDNIKESLDDIISSLQRAGKGKASQKAVKLQQVLLDELDKQVPEYAAARATWGDLSGEVTAQAGGSLPRIAKKTEKDFYDAGRMFLTQDSPASVRRAKEQILKVEGGQEKWNAAIRGGLESIWENSSRQYKSSVGRPEMMEAGAAIDFWAQLKGNKKQLARMQAALSPDQFRALNNLLNVFEATGKAFNYNSTTAAQLLGREALDKAGATGTAIKYVTAPYRIFGATSDAIGEGIKGRNIDALADVITRTDSVEELMKIQKGAGGWYNPKNLGIVARALSGAGQYGAGVGIGYPEMPIPSDAKPAQSGAVSVAPQSGGFVSPFSQR